MESSKSIQYNGKTINFTFNTGALKVLREELGYNLDYKKTEEILSQVEHLESFYADILFAAAKFYSRKDESFNYDRDDAHDWIETFGGLQKVIEAFFQSLNAGIKVLDNAIIPNEKLKVVKK